jgi:hypothetical protein
VFVFHYIPTSEQSVNSSLLSIQSLFIEFLAFGQLMIRRGGAFIATLSLSFHVYFFNLRRLIFYNKLSYKREHTVSQDNLCDTDYFGIVVHRYRDYSSKLCGLHLHHDCVRGWLVDH